MTQALTIERAKLPTTYTEAKHALSRCMRVDECKRWADKAAALASYAKQSRDEQMMDMAKRIRARAVERGGELLAQVKPAKGARTDLGGAVPLSRKAMANGAGLTPDEAKTMLRVANVPKAERDALIEGKNPPTVEQLAERGKRKTIVEPKPYRSEWCDWVFPVRNLKDIPACGLAVLAQREPTMRDLLLKEARSARRNLDRWIVELSKRKGRTSHA